MKLLGILLLLSALAATGYSLTCKTCALSTNDTKCDGPTMTCQSDDSCVFAYTKVTIGDKVTNQYTATCGKKKHCNIKGSLTFDTGSVLMATSCCDKDNCTTSFPAFPTLSTKVNNRTCDTCETDKFEECFSLKKQTCTGEETECGHTKIKLSGKQTLKDYMRGCATKSFCDVLGNQYNDIDGLKMDLKTFCRDGAADLRVGYLVVVVAAVLTKFMI
ncbi:uncharacterized protein RB166_010801 [Leptodactylus fuscus]|uniref:uncharacterized protein LOC142209838 n=1 Tax=Leptodactylus fuscus TaxID=238119 RepID=UPI003F4F29AF